MEGPAEIDDLGVLPISGNLIFFAWKSGLKSSHAEDLELKHVESITFSSGEWQLLISSGPFDLLHSEHVQYVLCVR